MTTFKDFINEKTKKRYYTIEVSGNCVYSDGVNIPPYVNWEDENDPDLKDFHKKCDKAEKKAEKEMLKLRKEGFSPMLTDEPCWSGTR
jgi:predicted DNA-binding WGR domain protein